jgi:hypothetical protein
VYKRADVVTALRALFNKKCAYCEFNYAPGGPEDIDHHRPKAAIVIDGVLIRPGYYWLGAEWTNLLPSCIDCNRRRKIVFIGGERRMSGKATHFPVAQEEQRWRSHEEPCLETPHLLNPCEEDPAAHLEVVPGGLLRAKLHVDVESVKGATSIAVYGLLRGDLVDARRSKELFVRAALESALKAAELAEKATDAATRDDFKRMAAKLLADARMHGAQTQPFLAVTRAVFSEFGLKI